MSQWKQSISSIKRLSDQTLFYHTLAIETLHYSSLFCSLRCLSFIQSQQPHWYLSLFEMQKLDNDTRLRAALFLVNVLSGPLCLLPLGKVPFTLWRCPLTMGQIPWATFCCFPPAGNCSQFPLFLEMMVKNCGWWMKCFFFRRSLLACVRNLGRGRHTMVGKVHLCVLGFSTGSLWVVVFCLIWESSYFATGITLKCLSDARQRQRSCVLEESTFRGTLNVRISKL